MPQWFTFNVGSIEMFFSINLWIIKSLMFTLFGSPFFFSYKVTLGKYPSSNVSGTRQNVLYNIISSNNSLKSWNSSK